MRCSHEVFGVKLSDSLALPRELARASSTTVWQLGSPGWPLRIAGLSGASSPQTVSSGWL